MKRILLILFVFSSLCLFSQPKFEMTRKEFLEKIEVVDTVPEEWNYKPNKLKSRSKLLKFKLPNQSRVFAIYLEKESYRRTGVLKRVNYYEAGQLIKQIYYDKNGEKNWLYEYKNKSSEEVIIYVDGASIKSKYPKDYTVYKYKTGQLVSKESYVNLKKEGVNEYYNALTGKIEKTTTYKKGKKIIKE